LHIKPTKTTRICSIRGCGSKDTVLVSRSSDFRGGIRLCRACAEGIAAYFAVEKPEEPAVNTEEPVEKPKRARKTAE